MNRLMLGVDVWVIRFAKPKAKPVHHHPLQHNTHSKKRKGASEGFHLGLLIHDAFKIFIPSWILMRGVT